MSENIPALDHASRPVNIRGHENVPAPDRVSGPGSVHEHKSARGHENVHAPDRASGSGSVHEHKSARGHESGGSIRRIKTSRVTLNVRESGAGPAIVMLHGWPESSFCWEGVIAHMPRNMHLIRPDLRGLGDSDRGGELKNYAKSELAQDVLQLLDEMGLREFGLVGHDWGGAVAQEIALMAGERVRALVLMNIHLINNPRGNAKAKRELDSKPRNRTWYQHFQQQPELPERMIPGNEEVWLRHFLFSSKRQRPFPEEAIREYVRCCKIPGTPGTAANYYRAMGLDFKRWMSLGEFKFPMPTLLLYGTRDPVIIPTFLDGYENCFERVNLVEANAGHFVQEELPEFVAEELTRFFAEFPVGR